jgi:hypothetical protein
MIKRVRFNFFLTDEIEKANSKHSNKKSSVCIWQFIEIPILVHSKPKHKISDHKMIENADFRPLAWTQT